MVTQPGVYLLHHGTHFERPDLLGADWAHLSEEDNSIFFHIFDKMMKTLNETLQGRGILIHSTPTGLMPVPAIDAQKPVEVSQASRRAHKSSTKEFQPPQPVSLLHWGHNSDASMEGPNSMSNWWGFRHVHARREMILLASQKRGGVASVTGMLEWN